MDLRPLRAVLPFPSHSAVFRQQSINLGNPFLEPFLFGVAFCGKKHALAKLSPPLNQGIVLHTQTTIRDERFYQKSAEMFEELAAGKSFRSASSCCILTAHWHLVVVQVDNLEKRGPLRAALNLPTELLELGTCPIATKLPTLYMRKMTFCVGSWKRGMRAPNAPKTPAQLQKKKLMKQAPVLWVIGMVWLTNAEIGHAQSSFSVITNPAPAMNRLFGHSLAAVGSNAVLVGALERNDVTNSGGAFLYNIGGALLTSFTNPNPSSYPADIGSAVAAVGTETVLIGAPEAGVAYLFATNGNVLTTFTNPAPMAARFGHSLAALGTDKVIIGAPNHSGVGIAYLFSADGALVATFNNPAPYFSDAFGSAVAAVGFDKVLVGEPGGPGANAMGAAHLFHTNGNLLMSYTNPTPSNLDFFGLAVCAVGLDKVLIAAREDDLGATDAGVAYLFSTNGGLLRTFTSPRPTYRGFFGNAVAAVDADKVMIAANQETNGAGFGIVYVFSIDGPLLVTLTNPITSSEGLFGTAIAVADSSTFFVGAPFVSNSVSDAGVVVRFGVPLGARARLSIEPQPNGQLHLLWPVTNASFFVLEQTSAISITPAASAWESVPAPLNTNGASVFVTVSPVGKKFFRLRRRDWRASF